MRSDQARQLIGVVQGATDPATTESSGRSNWDISVLALLPAVGALGDSQPLARHR
jgi:hypothetical protein